MPRKAAPKMVTRLVRCRDACTALAVSRMTFWRHWQTVFTDPRNPNHGQTVGRKVFEDELVVAVENGGGDRAKAAVLALRKQLGRV